MKLTINVDENIIVSAKKYAERKNSSLSCIVEEYLKSLTTETKSQNRKYLSKLAKELKGSVKDLNPKKSYKEILVDKHLGSIS